MDNRKIIQGDFILITDPRESSRYLKIGEVTKIETYPDGDIKEYTVRFKYDYYRGIEDFEKYGYELEDVCKVLQFQT